MLDGVMLLWFLLTALSLLFVAVDVRSTPASPVLKWGFILLRAYLEPLGEPASGGAHKGMRDNQAPGERGAQPRGKPAMDGDMKPVSNSTLAGMIIFSCAVFGLGLYVAIMFGGL